MDSLIFMSMPFLKPESHFPYLGLPAQIYSPWNRKNPRAWDCSPFPPKALGWAVPSWGCALRESQTSESPCDNCIDPEWDENTWNQWLHLKGETVEKRWDKAGHCSTETSGLCYRSLVETAPEFYWEKLLGFTVREPLTCSKALLMSVPYP